MSKVGKQILNVPTGVTTTVSGNIISVKGKLGEIKRNFDNSKIEIVVENNTVTFKKKGGDKKASQLWGTWASHIKNMMKGVSEGFTKKLLVEGVGYKWEVVGTEVKLALGFSHPIMMKGVSEGFTKKLLVEGVGYKWEVVGKEVKLALGFSHPIMMKIPEGLTIKTDKLSMDITGFDKEVVGSFAMKIRKLKQPEPYKGKGIRYSDEVIRRKQGKRSA